MKAADFFKPIIYGILLSLGLLFGGVLYAVTIDLIFFKKGDQVKADDFNLNFTNIKNGVNSVEKTLDERITSLETKLTTLDKSTLPAGTIIGWDRDFAFPAQITLPSLTNFVPCDGRAISDSTSIYNGKNIPLLNDPVSGNILIGSLQSSLSNNYSVGSGLSTINTFSVIWLCKIR